LVGRSWLPLPKNPTPALGLSGLACPRPEFSNPLRSKILHTDLDDDDEMMIMMLMMMMMMFMLLALHRLTNQS